MLPPVLRKTQNSHPECQEVCWGRRVGPAFFTALRFGRCFPRIAQAFLPCHRAVQFVRQLCHAACLPVQHDIAQQIRVFNHLPEAIFKEFGFFVWRHVTKQANLLFHGLKIRQLLGLS